MIVKVSDGDEYHEIQEEIILKELEEVYSGNHLALILDHFILTYVEYLTLYDLKGVELKGETFPFKNQNEMEDSFYNEEKLFDSKYDLRFTEVDLWFRPDMKTSEEIDYWVAKIYQKNKKYNDKFWNEAMNEIEKFERMHIND
jgi:hypothetical protein